MAIFRTKYAWSFSSRNATTSFSYKTFDQSIYFIRLFVLNSVTHTRYFESVSATVATAVWRQIGKRKPRLEPGEHRAGPFTGKYFRQISIFHFLRSAGNN
jgi:hypothetical protein